MGGFVRAVQEAGLPVNGYLVRSVDSTKDARALINAIIDEIGPEKFPTGIVAVNGAAAIGAMGNLVVHDVLIPEEESIIGYDGINYSGLLRVPLTTIYQLKIKTEVLAARQPIDTIERGEEGVSRQDLVIPCPVVRKSCRAVQRTERCDTEAGR